MFLSGSIVGWGVLGGIAIARYMKGKKLAILGAQSVGKTSLITYLTEQSLPKRHEPTSFPKDVKGGRIEIKDLKLKIWRGKDLPGSPDDYGNWKKLVDEADIILYLVRIDDLMQENKSLYKYRVEQDMHQIRRWLKKRDSQEFLLFIVGTGCDLTDEDFTILSRPEQAEYKQKIRNTSVLSKLILISGGGNNVRFVLGSLKSKETSENLVYDLIGEIKNNG